MSSKPSKNRAPEAEVPKDENVPVEEFDEGIAETAEVETVPAPKEKEKASAPADSKKKKKSKSGFRLSSIDPIILGSFVVFLAACLVVTGVTVYGIVAGDSSDQTAEYGDKVLVDYTGSYFAYYDQDGAVIFDTSMSNVGDDDAYAKSYEYKTKTEYSTLSVTIGSGDALAAFEDAIIGMKVGDETWIKIDSSTITGSDKYGPITDGVDKFTKAKSNGYTMAKISTIPLSDYKTLFNTTDVPDAGFTQYNVDSPYGWKVDVTMNGNGTVTIDYGAHVTVGQYTENGVTINVTDVTGANIAYEYQMDDFAENTKMLKTVFDGKIVYVISASGADMTYKTTTEIMGTTMYFYIKLVDFSS